MYWRNCLTLCKDVYPDALVISGDVYDRAIPPPEAVELFNEILTRLAAQGIRVLFIAGNHDSAVRLGFGAQLLRASGILSGGSDTLRRAARHPLR